ncbi:unnamed protein product [Paramecium sonneborni]|uniref:Transmembrane protein n=1 Tax=Paramecium sonneborni TaxID=65129 RepID=A0A8S1Q278_9CILI|nr:unnamed protein product [Paramecium sonneborni]
MELRKAETSNIPSNIRTRIIFQIYLLALGITLMVLSIIAYVSITENIIYIRNIVQNWNQLPIKQIRETDGDCNQNEELINNYNWPGINQGCDCREEDHYITPKRLLFNKEDKIYEKECNSSMRDAGCKDIDEMSSRNFNKLPIQLGNAKLSICAQRETANNTFAQNSPKSNECQEGEKKCGTASDYFYCTKENECPIFQIKNNLNNQSGIQNYFQTFRENEKTLPLVQFKIAQGNGVCRKVNERSITSGRSNYQLISDPGYDCERDQRFKLIYLFNEFYFYKVNNALDIAKLAPGYEISSQYEWGLYARHYINFTLSCRQYQQEFMDTVDILEDIETKQLVLMIISIICLVFFIILLILNCLTIKGYDLPCIKGKGSQESNTLLCIQASIKEAFQLIQAIIVIVSFSTVNGLINFYSNLIDENCADSITLDDISIIRNVFKDTIYNYNIAYIIMFFIGACIDLIFGAYLLSRYYQERKQLAQIRSGNQNNPEQDYLKQQQNRQINDFQQPSNMHPQQQFNIEQYPSNIQQQQIYQNQPIQNYQYQQNPFQTQN